MILAKGGASEPPNIGLPGKAGGAVAVRRTLASTICRMTIPTQVSRPRQLRDASTIMRLRPAHQSMINRRFNDRASCPARKSPKPALARKPPIHSPASGKGGHESAQIHSDNLSQHHPSSLPGQRKKIADAQIHRPRAGETQSLPLFLLFYQVEIRHRQLRDANPAPVRGADARVDIVLLWQFDGCRYRAVHQGLPTWEYRCTIRLGLSTLMSAFARCRRMNWWVASKRWFWALPGRAGGAVVEATVDHTLMRGSEPHDR